MTTTARMPRDLTTRRTPALGGLNRTILGIELRRLARNRRTVVFTLVMPVAFFFLFGANGDEATRPVGPGGHGSWGAYTMVSMALYGAILASTSGGAMVSVERAAGWSRQLRLTPLSPLAYIAAKTVSAMTMGLAAVLAVFVAGAFSRVDLPLRYWVACGLLTWLLSVVFAAFGLFMGYLLPSENVMQVIGPVLAVLAFAGGLFVPVSVMGDSVFSSIARFVPTYGVSGLAHAPVTGEPVQAGWVVNVVVWLAIFVAGAVWRFRRDTARV
jgi:ABC-2 type transport system permease protein